MVHCEVHHICACSDQVAIAGAWSGSFEVGKSPGGSDPSSDSFYLERISVFCQPMPLPSCSGFASFVYLHTIVGVDRVHRLACLKGPLPEDRSRQTGEAEFQRSKWGYRVLSRLSISAAIRASSLPCNLSIPTSSFYLWGETR